MKKLRSEREPAVTTISSHVKTVEILATEGEKSLIYQTQEDLEIKTMQTIIAHQSEDESQLVQFIFETMMNSRPSSIKSKVEDEE